MDDRAPRSLARPFPRGLVSLVLGIALLLVAGPVLPRAAFKPDDYRYLWQLREMDDEGASALFAATVVENRWDHWWWIEDGTYVRFLRPFVITSFAVDRALFGEDPRAFLAANLVWHLLAALALHRCLARLLASRGGALVGALAFTVGAARYEHVAYAAGRTDTFAALAFFGAFALFLGRRARPTRSFVPLVGAAYAVALLAKEYAALLPVLFLAADRWVPADGAGNGARSLVQSVRRRAGLYVVSGVVLAAYVALRAAALGAGGAGARPYPYFHLPPRPGWAEHALTAWLQDGVYLVTGGVGPAFLGGFSELAATAGVVAVATSALVVAALLAWGAVRGGAGRFCAFQFALTLVPLLPLYTTGRYLVLPSLGWCGLLGLATSRLGARAPLLGALAALAVLLPQAVGLHRAASALPLRPPGKSEGDVLAEVVRESALDLQRPLVLVDAPLHWLHLQFLPHVIAVEEDVRPPAVWVLSKTAPDAAVPPTRVRVVGPRELELVRPGAALVLPHPWGDFDAQPLGEGRRVREDGYEVEVVESRAGAPTRIRVRFDRALEELQVVALQRTAAGPRWVSALP